MPRKGTDHDFLWRLKLKTGIEIRLDSSAPYYSEGWYYSPWMGIKSRLDTNPTLGGGYRGATPVHPRDPEPPSHRRQGRVGL